MSEKKRFVTTGREEVAFEVDGQDYVLVPASGLAARRYREASLVGTELEMEGEGDDARRTFKKLQAVAGVESRLVADCCYKVLRDGGREGPLTPEFVEAWTGDVTKWAFDQCKRISPWLEEKGDGNDVARLKAERARLDERIAKLESTDPKGSRPTSTTSSGAPGG
jgi:hypothetical protein